MSSDVEMGSIVGGKCSPQTVTNCKRFFFLHRAFRATTQPLASSKFYVINLIDTMRATVCGFFPYVLTHHFGAGFIRGKLFLSLLLLFSIYSSEEGKK